MPCQLVVGGGLKRGSNTGIKRNMPRLQRNGSADASIEGRLDKICEQLEEVNQKLTKAENKNKDQAQKIIRIEEAMNQLLEMGEEIKTLKTENRNLKDRLAKLEEINRRGEINKIKNVIEIHGIPATKEEDIKKIAQRIMEKIDIEIKGEDIEECYRPKALEGRLKPICMKMKRYEIKEKIVKQAKLKSVRLGEIHMEPENKKKYI